MAYCAREVSIKASPNRLEIYCSGNLIATHPRSYGKNKSVYTLDHYLPLLENKGRSILYARPVRETIPEYFLDWLSSQEMSPKQLTEILQRCSQEDFRAVMDEHSMHAPTSKIVDPVTVKPVDLTIYDTFLNRKAGAL